MKCKCRDIHENQRGDINENQKGEISTRFKRLQKNKYYGYIYIYIYVIHLMHIL